MRHLKHHEIDKGRWDQCIMQAPNGLVYGMSWWLDIVSPGWEALVDGDYETIMPLPVKKKWGFTYLMQPILTQQLGVFSLKDDYAPEPFFTWIKKRYKYTHIKLNEHNTALTKEIATKSNVNQLLWLDKPYNELYKNFAERTRRNIKKAGKNNLIIQEDCGFEEITEFLFSNAKPNLGTKEKKIISYLVQTSKIRLETNSYAIRYAHGDILSIAFVIYFKKRVIILLQASNTQGKELSCMHYIVNLIIQKNANQDKILDMEGSNIEGISYFNQGFGTAKHYYHSTKINNLPDIMRLIKA